VFNHRQNPLQLTRQDIVDRRREETTPLSLRYGWRTSDNPEVSGIVVQIPHLPFSVNKVNWQKDGF